MLIPATTETTENDLPVEAPPPSESLTYISCFSPTFVFKFQIELERGKKNHWAQDQWLSQSHLRHILRWNSRMHTSPSGI